MLEHMSHYKNKANNNSSIQIFACLYYLVYVMSVVYPAVRVERWLRHQSSRLVRLVRLRQELEQQLLLTPCFNNLGSE